MQINNVRNTSFTGVTPIVVKRTADLTKLEKQVRSQASHDNFDILDVTNAYLAKSPKKSDIIDSSLTQSAKDGNRVALLITGEDYIKYCTSKSGYKTDGQLTNRVNQAPVDFTQTADTLLKTIEE